MELAWPPAICRATDSAVLIGIANPADACWSLASLPAVSMPMTPPELASGPPESPGMMSALVWIIPFRFSEAVEPRRIAGQGSARAAGRRVVEG